MSCRCATAEASRAEEKGRIAAAAVGRDRRGADGRPHGRNDDDRGRAAAARAQPHRGHERGQHRLRAGHRARRSDVVTGGVARPQSYELIGPIAERSLEGLNVDVMFLGVDGVNAAGVTTHDEIEAQTNRKMVERAARVIVVCDSSKIGRSALSSICPLVGDRRSDHRRGRLRRGARGRAHGRRGGGPGLMALRQCRVRRREHQSGDRSSRPHRRAASGWSPPRSCSRLRAARPSTLRASPRSLAQPPP